MHTKFRFDPYLPLLRVVVRHWKGGGTLWTPFALNSIVIADVVDFGFGHTKSGAIRC